MPIDLSENPKVFIKYYTTNHYEVWINDVKQPLMKTPHSMGPLTYKTLETFLERVDPALIGYAEFVWDIIAAGVPTPIWAINTTGSKILAALEKAKKKIPVEDWSLWEKGMLGAPKYLMEREYGEERLGRYTTDEQFIYVGYDTRGTVQWIAWVRRNGTTFTDASSLALLSLAKPTGTWAPLTVAVDKASDEKSTTHKHITIHTIDANATFRHFAGDGAGKGESRYSAAQTTGRHRLFAYRNDFPFDPAASYPWQM